MIPSASTPSPSNTATTVLTSLPVNNFPFSGTLLQQKGLQAGELPEIWNIEKKQALIEIHQNYFESGSDIVLTNTFVFL